MLKEFQIDERYYKLCIIKGQHVPRALQQQHLERRSGSRNAAVAVHSGCRLAAAAATLVFFSETAASCALALAR